MPRIIVVTSRECRSCQVVKQVIERIRPRDVKVVDVDEFLRDIDRYGRELGCGRDGIVQALKSTGMSSKVIEVPFAVYREGNECRAAIGALEVIEKVLEATTTRRR